jgi:hypothetical protein
MGGINAGKQKILTKCLSSSFISIFTVKLLCIKALRLLKLVGKK